MEAVPLFAISIWAIAKVLAVFALILYAIFALVVVRQVQLMTDTLEVGFETPIKILSYLHLAFGISVLLFALIIL